MAEDLVVLDGSTFFVSDRNGDVEPRDYANGFFYGDMRHLSTWGLLVDGTPMLVLSARTPDYYSARIVGTLGTARVGLNPTISIRRDRFVSDGVHEDLLITNNCEQEQNLKVEVRFQSDFADLFEVKDRQPKRGVQRVRVEQNRATLWYERDGFSRGTIIAFSEPCAVDEVSAVLNLRIKPREEWHMCIDVSCIVDGREIPPGFRCGAFGVASPKMPLSLQQWLDDAPRLECESDTLAHTYRQSLLDLAALRFRPREDLTWSLPAAGLPWFMALFGRDALITSYQALPFQPRLALTALEALAALQAKEVNEFRDAEPGKILHELRCGELASLGEVPHTPYYGTHDATPVFIILLDEYERWTGDVDFVRKLEPAVRAALTWIERYGDPDGDGYLEYSTRSPKGLRNQCWKDSWNSILFANGQLAELPIATCEIQGYAYDARVRAARLARVTWGDQTLAARLEADAATLRDRFNRDFWSEKRGHYVLALDGRKRQVDALTSNVGHLLWSGIIDQDRAALTAQRLLAPDMFSGWGIRTMSAKDAGYNPIEYHNGTVWPHDTAIIAEGLRRYGFREEASLLARAVIDAAGFFAYRLPEVFAGFSRVETGMPVEYPTASRPHAWAAGAPLMAIRTLLGIDVVDGQLRSEAHVLAEFGRISLLSVACQGKRVDTAAVAMHPTRP